MCITTVSFIQNKNILSNYSYSFKFYIQKIKLNNISIYKRQLIIFSYKISVKIYCNLVLCALSPTLSHGKKENSERMNLVLSRLHEKLNNQIFCHNFSFGSILCRVSVKSLRLKAADLLQSKFSFKTLSKIQRKKAHWCL